MTHRVLVVDDSASMRDFIGTAIEEACGVDVDTAGSGLEALKLLPAHPYDFIFTDINMPDINGLELIRFIRQHPSLATVPVVVISTEATTKDRERAMQLGGTDYLVKPFTADQVVAAFKKYTGA
jgi:two-component system chemotaxis response regulator CheY